jgi:hypothetical protein
VKKIRKMKLRKETILLLQGGAFPDGDYLPVFPAFDAETSICRDDCHCLDVGSKPPFNTQLP